MNSVIEYLTQEGYSTISDGFYSTIDAWESWYQNSDEDFHNSHFFNGISNVTRQIYTLGMAKTVCEDWASLLMNEKVDISLNEPKSDEILKNILDTNGFHTNANRLTELAFALGTGAFVERLKDGEICIDYIRAEHIYPLSWDSKGIHECAFSSVVGKGDKDIISLQIHTRDPRTKEYMVKNVRLVSSEDAGVKEIPLPDGVPEEFYTGSTTPLFQIMMPNVINSIDLDCPLGASIFAGCLDVLKEIDATFDSFNVEIETGRRMVFLSSRMFGVDKDGNMRNVIGQKESILRWVGEMEEGQMLHDYTPSLRIDQLKEALQFQLNLLSQKVGMGSNRYDFSPSGAKTATEVISEDSDMYQSLKKHQILLERALRGVVEAIQVLLQMLGISINIENISISFDDSIITDKDEERRQYQLEVAAGLMSAVEYRMRVYAEDEETARKMLPDAFGEIELQNQNGNTIVKNEQGQSEADPESDIS